MFRMCGVMKFSEYLRSIKACKAALEWVDEKSLEEAWATCERPDWMFWLVWRTVNARLIVSCAAQFARSVVHLNPDPRVLTAIEVAEAFARGETVDAKVTYAARSAAYAAARAAARAADAAAWAAARSAAWAAARSAARSALGPPLPKKPNSATSSVAQSMFH